MEDLANAFNLLPNKIDHFIPRWKNDYIDVFLL